MFLYYFGVIFRKIYGLELSEEQRTPEKRKAAERREERKEKRVRVFSFDWNTTF